MKINGKKTIWLWAGNGESGMEYTGRQWQRLCTFIKKASEREALPFVTDKFPALRSAEQPCWLQKDETQKLATALERVLPSEQKTKSEGKSW